MTAKLKKFMSMDKKGNIGGKLSGLMDNVVGLIAIMALLGSVTGLLYVFLGNFTNALTAGDTSGIGTAFVVILGIILTLGLVSLVMTAISRLKGGNR